MATKVQPVDESLIRLRNQHRQVCLGCFHDHYNQYGSVCYSLSRIKKDRILGKYKCPMYELDRL